MFQHAVEVGQTVWFTNDRMTLRATAETTSGALAWSRR
jgi:hypothetical protein